MPGSSDLHSFCGSFLPSCLFCALAFNQSRARMPPLRILRPSGVHFDFGEVEASQPATGQTQMDGDLSDASWLPEADAALRRVLRRTTVSLAFAWAVWFFFLPRLPRFSGSPGVAKKNANSVSAFGIFSPNCCYGLASSN